MAKISKRLGRLGVDWKDAEGKRRWKTFRGKNAETEARIFLGRKLIESGSQPSPDLGVTFAEYAPRWLAVSAVRLRPRSLTIYKSLLDRHLLPRFGLFGMRDITASMLRDFLALKAEDLSRSTVSGMLAVLSSLFSLASEDGVVGENPTRGLWRRLGLARRTRSGPVRAMTADQLRAFLEVVNRHHPRHRLAFHLLALTGLRVGEVLGAQWGDIDWRADVLHVSRQVAPGSGVAAPKSRRSHRVVDLSPGLVELLREAHVDRKEADLRTGRGETLWVVQPWTEDPTGADSYSAWRGLRRAMRLALKKAGLPLHFTPHSLRHTFASLHLARGESPKYVQEQLGHESIQITVDVYGRWLPTRNPRAAQALEDSILKANR